MSTLKWITLYSLLMAVGLVSQTLPVETSTLFSGSGNCALCHTKGSPNTAALTDAQGRDVSPATYWRSTMMANSSKDPFWQAKVQAEVASNPHLQSIIEDKCTTCHAPMGAAQAEQDGQHDYSFDEMLADPLAMDGVSCTVCHQIENVGLGESESFSGGYSIGQNRLIFGPFANPVTGPMMMNGNYTPTFSSHMESSELCATCHTLFTPFVNDAGEVVGEAPEQVPYFEWLNSDYPGEGIACQSCHMPALDENIALSNRPQWLGTRNPLHTHEFVGANVFMLKLLKQFGNQLGVDATSAQFDSTIARTLKMLQHQSVELAVSADWISGQDSMEIDVVVQNLSGHKFPTAYPSRRAWLELTVADDSGDTVFHSGAWDGGGEIIGLDSIFEPHHDTIREESQVQIYQNIPRDVNGDKTYTLLRIADYLKDNRIPPRGYRSDGVAADTTRVIGRALVDPDFNQNDLAEGTGADVVHFRIGGLHPDETYEITASMNYQSLSPRFAEDLFTYDLPEVVTFRGFYEEMDRSPVRMVSSSYTLSATGTIPEFPRSPLVIQTFPNPFNPTVRIVSSIPGPGEITLSIFDLQGRLLYAEQQLVTGAASFDTIWIPRNREGSPLETGIYLVQLEYVERGTDKKTASRSKIAYLK